MQCFGFRLGVSQKDRYLGDPGDTCIRNGIRGLIGGILSM